MINEATSSMATSSVLVDNFPRDLNNPNSIEIKILVAAAFFTLLAALAAWFATYQTAKAAKDQLLQSLHKQFFEIIIAFPRGRKATLSAHNKQLLGNFFDYVGWLVRKKKIEVNDIELMKTVIKSMYKSFGSGYRKQHGSIYFRHWSWLSKQV